MIETNWSALIKHSLPVSDSEKDNTSPRIYPLTDACIIEVSGDGAEKLLQGQITCDTRTLNDQQGAFGAICTPQGRMFSLFRIVRNENSFLLKMHQSTVEPFLQRIEKYRQFFKADIQVKKDWVSFGLYLPDAVTSENATLNNWLNSLPEGANSLLKRANSTVFRLPTQANCWEIWLPKDSWLEDSNSPPLKELFGTLQPSIVISEVNDWNIKMALCGIPELAEQNIDQLVPHMINLHKIGGVSFKKGCYTGQEIVARMEYLGKLKKQVYCYQILSEHPFKAESVISDSDGTNLGSIISSYKNVNGVAGLALLPRSLEDSLECNSQPLTAVIEGQQVGLTLSIPAYLPL